MLCCVHMVSIRVGSESVSKHRSLSSNSRENEGHKHISKIATKDTCTPVGELARTCRINENTANQGKDKGNSRRDICEHSKHSSRFIGPFVLILFPM